MTKMAYCVKDSDQIDIFFSFFNDNAELLIYELLLFLIFYQKYCRATHGTMMKIATTAATTKSSLKTSPRNSFVTSRQKRMTTVVALSFQNPAMSSLTAATELPEQKIGDGAFFLQSN